MQKLKVTEKVKKQKNKTYDEMLFEMIEESLKGEKSNEH